MKLNQKGFAMIEAALIIVIAAIIGGTGYYVYHTNQQTDKTLGRGNSSSGKPAKTGKTKTGGSAGGTESAGPSALVINEWGVKVSMEDASKVTYTYSKNCDDLAGPCDSSISLAVKPQYLQNKSCKVSVSVSRLSSVDQGYASSTKQVGTHYFALGGNPYNCGNSHDDNLNSQIRKEFSLNNLQPA